MKKTQVKVICERNADMLEERINEFLDDVYKECDKTACPKNIIDIKISADEQFTTAIIIYEIG